MHKITSSNSTSLSLDYFECIIQMFNKIVRTNAVKISLEEVTKQISKGGLLTQWQIDPSNTKLTRECEFADYERTWAFLTQVSMRSHIWGHHPTITTTYNKVKLELTTHDLESSTTDSGALSNIDIRLANKIEKYIQFYKHD